MKSFLDLFEKQTDKKIAEVPIEKITPSRYQPRMRFDEEELQELSDSIKAQGLIQPITVREIEDHYEIIAGERRFRACKMAGFSTVPCYILTPTEDEAAQMALVENVQRKDLTAVEEAKSYVQIMRQTGYTQKELAEKIGKSQSTIANKIRLLSLPEEVQQGVLEEKISERHARALLNLEPKKVKQAYRKIVRDGMNVAETEKYIAKLNTPEKTHRHQKTKGYSKNARIAVNSVNQCVEMIRKLGIDARLEENETDEDIVMTVRFPK